MSNKFLGIDLDKTNSSFKLGARLIGDAFFSLLPKKIQTKLQVSEEKLTVSLNHNVVNVIKTEKGHDTVCFSDEYVDGQFNSDLIDLIKKEVSKDRGLFLQLPDDMVLSKEILFPVSVIDNLKQTVFYELDKHTPFKKSDLYYDVIAKSQTSINVTAELSIVHKKEIEPILTKFKQAKIAFDSASTKAHPEINLIPVPLRRKKPFLNIGINTILCFTAIILLAASLLVPLYLKRVTVKQLEKEVATLTQKASGERELIAERDNKVDLVTSFVDSRPTPLINILEDLSKKMPDTTWVKLLTYRDGKFSIRGESDDSAEIINLLSATPLYEQVEFISPIVRSRKSGKELFRIGFELAPTQKANP